MDRQLPIHGFNFIRNYSALKGRFIKAQGCALGTFFNALPLS